MTTTYISDEIHNRFINTEYYSRLRLKFKMSLCNSLDVYWFDSYVINKPRQRIPLTIEYNDENTKKSLYDEFSKSSCGIWLKNTKYTIDDASCCFQEIPIGKSSSTVKFVLSFSNKIDEMMFRLRWL